MTPLSDGSRWKALAGKMDPKAAEALQSALVEAISVSVEVSSEAAELAVSMAAKQLYSLPEEQQKVLAGNAVKAVNDNLVAIANTALDAFADSLAQAHTAGVDVGAAIAAASAGAVLGGASLGKVRHAAYRAGSVIGDVEAVASGDPKKIVRRAEQHIFWRAFGKLGRSLFRNIGGK